jgi:predicted esterase
VGSVSGQVASSAKWQSGDVVNGIIYYKQFVNYGAGRDSWLHFALKMPPGWKTGDAIRGVMCICTWRMTPEGVMTNLREGNPLIQWAVRNNYALMSWSPLGFFSMGVSNDEMNDKQDAEWSKRFDIAARKWEYSIQQLTLKYKLPAKHFLLYGISNGAQTAHRLVLRKPEYFAAIHIHVNSSYDNPSPGGKNLAWLVTTGEREYGYPASQRFYYSALELGYPVIYKAGENLGHSSSPQIERLSVSFFDYLLTYLPDLREKDAKYKGDPYQLIRRPSYVGDWLNQQAFPYEKAHLVQGRYQTALPTKEVAKAWGPLFDK